jgi:hypothetical protein
VLTGPTLVNAGPAPAAARSRADHRWERTVAALGELLGD